MALHDTIYRSLTPRISPMVYIMMFVSVIIGFCFLTGFGMASPESVLYSTGVLVDRHLWGGFLLFTASTAFIGMCIDNDAMIRFGGISGFMAWTFASISVLLAGHVYILLTVALFHLLFHGYVYLASQFGLLKRIPSS